MLLKFKHAMAREEESSSSTSQKIE